MSKQKPRPPKKKVVVTSTKKEAPVAASRRTSDSTNSAELEFGRQNYMLMGAGAALVFLGLLLMSGGSMPSPEVWDDSIIYSFRRTALAPFVILVGLVVEIYAIFKKA